MKYFVIYCNKDKVDKITVYIQNRKGNTSFSIVQILLKFNAMK